MLKGRRELQPLRDRIEAMKTQGTRLLAGNLQSRCNDSWLINRRTLTVAAPKMNQQKNDNDLESFFNMGRSSTAPRQRTNSTDPFFDQQFPNKGGSEAAKRTSTGASSNIKKASSSSSFVDDLSSIFGPPSSGDFQEVEGETEERRQARLDRHQRTQERAVKALAEKN